MWYEIMKECNCKATSTRSSCGDERKMAITHRNCAEDGNGQTSRLDYIVALKMASNQVHGHSDVKLWSTWDYHFIYTTIQEEDDQGYFT